MNITILSSIMIIALSFSNNISAGYRGGNWRTYSRVVFQSNHDYRDPQEFGLVVLPHPPTHAGYGSIPVVQRMARTMDHNSANFNTCNAPLCIGVSGTIAAVGVCVCCGFPLTTTI